MISDEYVFSLEERIRVLEEKQKNQKKYNYGLTVEALIKKVYKAGEKGISPSIINRSLNGPEFQKRIKETKEVSLIIKQIENVGRPLVRYVHSDFLK